MDDLNRRLDRLETRLDQDLREHQQEQREQRVLLEDVRRQLVEFGHTRESLGRAFRRVEALETRDREDAEARIELSGAIKQLTTTLNKMERHMEELPGLKTTVSHHNRALWLLAGTVLAAVSAVVIKVFTGG
ncbi:hypothetical protein [Abyssibacter profundi]|uniref:Uncharacterized protein n=1 Tax=Abyssibacter profundi TaxID=2182787 RepID=A0A363ULD1_9GAMM|nr:hypothetical protein [Abyssibacter profundi]PWN56207.1 hypothetical protein DEH80_08005 [Abyssibacter profundi]